MCTASHLALFAHQRHTSQLLPRLSDAHLAVHSHELVAGLTLCMCSSIQVTRLSIMQGSHCAAHSRSLVAWVPSCTCTALGDIRHPSSTKAAADVQAPGLGFDDSVPCTLTQV